jgi:hypothetical protein
MVLRFKHAGFGEAGSRMLCKLPPLVIFGIAENPMLSLAGAAASLHFQNVRARTGTALGPATVAEADRVKTPFESTNK